MAVVAPQKYTPTHNNDVIPQNYTEMFKVYYDYIKKLVYKHGIDQRNVEDVTMAIILAFYKNDALADYDANFTVKRAGVARKALFRTFLSGFVVTYVHHHRVMQAKRYRREGLSLDAPLDASPDDSRTVYDVVAPAHEDTHEDLEREELVNQIRQRIAALPKRNQVDRCDMPVLFEAMLEQSAQGGRVSGQDLADQFGVSKTTIQNWTKRLREEISPILEEN